MESIDEITPIVLSEFNGDVYSLKSWLRIGSDAIPVINVKITDIPEIDTVKLKEWAESNPKDWRTKYIEETIRTVEFVKNNENK